METTTRPINKADLAELYRWAEQITEQANGWAERAEVSRGERKELTHHLDALASRASQIKNLASVLHGR